MAKEENGKGRIANKYRRVLISSLDRGRHGKHFDLVQGILDELTSAKTGSALVIPLESVDGVKLANLRSAVHRASTAAGLEIETLADNKNFYVWKKGLETTGDAR
jgi:hypothetical protein